MSNKKKILILGANVNRKNHGGVVTFTKGLLNSPLKDKYTLDWERFEFRGRGIAKVFNIPADFRKLKRKMQEGQYDVVHANVSIYQLSFFKIYLYNILKRKYGFKLLVHLHGGMLDNIRFFKNFFVRILSKADHLIFLSEPQKAGFTAYPSLKNKMSILPNFLTSDAPPLNGQSTQNKTTFLFIARVIREKGIFDLLEAVSLLTPEERSKMRLLVCGTGESLEEAKAYSNQKKLTECVDFLGFVKGASKINALQQADICVLPTYWDEGFPFTILEAMSYGQGVISTDKGAIAEVIVNNENGYIVPPQDPMTLSKRMSKLINDETEKHRFSKNSYQRFQEKYNMNGPGVKAFSRVYEALWDEKTINITS